MFLTSVTAFQKAVNEYVPYHNKTSWNSKPTDKSQQLILDCWKYQLLSEEELSEKMDMTIKELKGWTAGCIPKVPARKRLKKVLLTALSNAPKPQ